MQVLTFPPPRVASSLSRGGSPATRATGGEQHDAEQPVWHAEGAEGRQGEQHDAEQPVWHAEGAEGRQGDGAPLATRPWWTR
jgi:hypothetical protein